jgi:hypothetical protein
VTGPRPKTCTTCGRGIPASEPYYRFTLTLQGEQDVLDAPPGSGLGDELASLLKRLEEAPESPQELEEQVHWERSGVVCSACRSVVVRTLSACTTRSSPYN